MSRIPTAEEFSDNYRFLEDYSDDINYENIYKFAKDFAKLHVKAALEAAVESVSLNRTCTDKEVKVEISEFSILNAYPDNLIQ